jgi:hypothetical protein
MSSRPLRGGEGGYVVNDRGRRRARTDIGVTPPSITKELLWSTYRSVPLVYKFLESVSVA